MTAPPLSVLPVRDRSEVRRFLDVGYQLRHDEPRSVPPLRADLLARVRFRRNPFWKRADGRLFLARRGIRMAGRISVQLDASLNAERSQALWGWFEAADQGVANALFGVAAQWARDEGAASLVGPASFHAFEEAGLLIEGHDEPASFLSPWHPPEYAAMVTTAGSAPAGGMATIRVPLRAGERADAGEPPRLAEAERAVLERAGELTALTEGPATWSPTVPEVRSRFRRLRPAMDRSLCVVAGGGVGVAIPDLNEVLVRLNEGLGPSAAARVMREMRRARKGAALGFLAGEPTVLLKELCDAAGAAGYQHLDVTVGEKAESARRALVDLGGAQIRGYRLYRMDL